ncbi:MULTISPECIES: VOC family protein [unclassified Shinella]|jgi:catechol 2,3-dioxygenase-like lactoylglutathione lyase family enzyme|uniref:VOC family protein n=1 Tax=unclassified Shinella TaxID=2643062 RepID=UPI0006836B9D|nr:MULTISPECIES: VOC family protein [unclassified Shinella]KNY16705.1 lactoylglutathione lyase [Shinella sp. SUS2]KOC77039.1 lactoylglutathione lyase [Shinella sp. GWS1]MCO5153892.1 VOC family protein [Shinella sp.]MDC7262885.1 VOC family protein [Shinella sp. HY16]MDC7269780.1 VOC family protein [Shinella sp. YZ44]
MDAYTTLGTPNAAATTPFYDAVLATIGWAVRADYPGLRGYTKGGGPDGFTLWLCTPFDGAAASVGNGTMVGFPAASHEEVEAFHAAALAHGGTDEGAPGPRPHYGPHWYSAYVRDPVGNKLSIVFDE